MGTKVGSGVKARLGASRESVVRTTPLDPAKDSRP